MLNVVVKTRRERRIANYGLVTFAQSDICANDIFAKWPALPVMSHHRWLMTDRARRGKGTELGEGERD